MNQGPFPIGDLPDTNVPKKVEEPAITGWNPGSPIQPVLPMPPTQLSSIFSGPYISGHLTHTDPHSSPLMDACQKIGFMPDVLFNIAGTTFDDPETGMNRQEYLAKAMRLYNTYGQIQLSMSHDKGNKYDDFAVSVYLPTKDNAAGEMSDWRPVGFVPKKVCWNCFAPLSGKNATLSVCPECGYGVEEDKHCINRYLLDAKETGEPKAAVVWISQGKEGKYIGVRIAVKFE